MGGMRIEGATALSGAIKIPLSDIEVVSNPSRDGFPVDISDLKDKIRRDGQLVPGLALRVKPGNTVRLTAGFGRYQALKEIEAEDGKARFMTLVVTDGNEEKAFFTNLAENHNRRGLSHMNYSNAIRRMTEQYSMSNDKIAAEFNMSVPWVWQHQQLQSLEREIQEKVHSGEMSMDTALDLVKESSENRQVLFTAMKEEIAVGSIQATDLITAEREEVTKDGEAPKKATTKGRKGKARPPVPKMTKKTLKAAKEKINGKPVVDKVTKRNWQEVYDFFEVMIGSPVIGPRLQATAKTMLNLLVGSVEDDEATAMLHRSHGEGSYNEDEMTGAAGA